jgi:DNA repair protein RecO (recombination protein O)
MPSRERSLRTEAIVLRHTDWGEADRILTLYTRQMGKLRAIAKGVRKLRSRKAGHLEPFTRVNLLLAKGRDWMIVTQAETIDAYLELRASLLGVGRAAYAIELLDRFSYEEGENEALYLLLTNTLARLVSQADPALVLRYYEMRMLDLLGFRPKLFHCARCEAEIQPQDQFFSAEQGGVLCPPCGAGAAGVRPISLQALRYLRHFQRSSFAEARRAQPSAAIHQEMEILMHHYLTYLLERNLNAPAFLRRVQELES